MARRKRHSIQYRFHKKWINSRQRQARRPTAEYCAKLLETWEELPPIFRTSSEDGRGRDALLNYIEEMNKLPLLGCEQ